MARKPRALPKTGKQSKREIKKDLDKAGLLRFPVTNVKPGTEGTGILGIGLLNERPPVLSDFNEGSTTSSGKPLVSPKEVKKYKYFFSSQNNPSIRGSEESQYFFYVIESIYEISLSDCSKQLGIPEKNITPITENQLLNSTFNHPVYITQNYGNLKIRYGEIARLPQKDPGRMDNIPIGFPDFNYNPSPISTQKGMTPSAPFPSFYVEGFPTGATLINVPPGGTVQFINNTPTSPPQIRASSYLWDFGPDASPTGSTASNPLVDYSGSSGSQSVYLTASNSIGTKTFSKINYIFR